MSRNEEASDSETVSRTNRRSFLRRSAAATVAGVLGVTATSGVAAAGDFKGSSAEDASAPGDFPAVTTRGHFDSEANLINGETTYSYDKRGDFGPIGDEELVIFVHGFNVDDQSALDAAYECQLALEQNGYNGDVIGYSWDSDEGDSADLGWGDAKDIARENGEKLANYITNWNYYVGEQINLIAHSLGARVAADAAESIVADFNRSNEIDTTVFVGGAIDDQEVGEEDEYGAYLEIGANAVDNYYNNDDQVLDDAYRSREWDTAVGQYGIQNGANPPENYDDDDVTNVVDKHGDYYKRDVGCMSQIVNEF